MTQVDLPNSARRVQGGRVVGIEGESGRQVSVGPIDAPGLPKAQRSPPCAGGPKGIVDSTSLSWWWPYELTRNGYTKVTVADMADGSATYCEEGGADGDNTVHRSAERSPSLGWSSPYQPVSFLRWRRASKNSRHTCR